uniref:arginine transporter n=1 Tax=Yoonia sp. TaxID=2212373 RepID=UPI0040470FC6
MVKYFVISAFIFVTACGTRVTGDVGKACMKADRNAASSSLCSCVQQAADQTLSSSEQRRAAAFFEDPQLAQDARQSSGRSSEAFWTRYKQFSATATQMCR